MEPQINTDKHGKELLYQEVTSDILQSSFEVHNTLGCGLLEKIYENSLMVDLKLKGRTVTSQKDYKVYYKNEVVGIYYADLIVDNKVIIEIKAVENIDDIHKAQLLNYLKISKLRVGLIINFAKPKLEYKRLIN